MIEQVTVTPMRDGSDLLLQHFGQKLTSGNELTQPEGMMSITAASKGKQGQYGPTPETFKVDPMDLPPSTIGEIINHTL